MEILSYLKNLIKERKKKYYIFIIGKMNEPKLANFPEIDVYCLIGCGRNSIIDSKVYMKSIVTPFELQIALEKGREWNGSYFTSFDKILSESGSNSDQQQEEEEIRYSLVSGSLKKNTFLTNELSTDQQLVETSMNLVETKDALNVFEQRSYKGLEMNVGETPISEIEFGRGGIARLYGHEK
jgi:diphthamide biosynthesis protein 2